MLLDELYEYYGSWDMVGRKIDVSRGTVPYWRKIGYIPLKSQLLIERKTNGLFKALEEHAAPNLTTSK